MKDVFINSNRIHHMDLFIIPLQLLIIAGFVFRQKIVDRIREPFKKNFTFFSNDMKFKIDNKLKTLLIPIVITVIAYVAFVKLIGFFYTPFSDPLYTLDSVILAPISEQILQGLFLIGLSFVIYGALYYLYKENLLPTIVAHAAWNIIILNPIPF